MKIYRGGCGGGCTRCASNYYYQKYMKIHLIEWEKESDRVGMLSVAPPEERESNPISPTLST